MLVTPDTAVTAFHNERQVASGPLAEVFSAIKAAWDETDGAGLLIFDDQASRQVELDLRGSRQDTLARLTPPAEARAPGRPKLGVTAREVTLLPRHWEWLAAQPGGASVALRKLVEAARKAEETSPRAAKEAAYRFMTTMAGDRPNYEEAVRALFAGDVDGLASNIWDWPPDVVAHVRKLARL